MHETSGMARCRKQNAFVSHHKRQACTSSAVPLLLADPEPGRPSVRIQQCAASDNGSLPSGPTHSSRCFSPKARRGSSHGFMHCLASTGSSLKHSTRVLVLVIAEYFTDTEYTPLQALRQGAAACCFSCLKPHRTIRLIQPSREDVNILLKNPDGICAIKQKKKTHVGDILTKTRKIYLHVKQNTSIIK